VGTASCLDISSERHSVLNRVQGSRFRIGRFGTRVQGERCTVWGSGFRSSGMLFQGLPLSGPWFLVLDL